MVKYTFTNETPPHHPARGAVLSTIRKLVFVQVIGFGETASDRILGMWANCNEPSLTYVHKFKVI